jgi:hypothetical protein
LDENLHQLPDNPSTFMSRIKQKAIGKIAANDEDAKYSTQESPGTEVLTFLRSLGKMWRVIAERVVLDPDFQTAYMERMTNCFIDTLDKVHSASQIKKDPRELVLLLEKIWDDDGSNKRWFLQNTQNIGMIDFIETCNFLRSHAVRYDQKKRNRLQKSKRY